MRRAVPWLVGAALVAATGAVVAATPPGTDLRDAFLIRGDAGEAVTSRTLSATALDAVFADRVTVDESDWAADGNWLVVTVAASAVRSEVEAEIPLASVVIDGEVFHATERASTSLTRADLHVGTETTGMLAFELPAGTRSGSAELRLSPQLLTPHLDDVVAIALPLDGLAATASIEIMEPELWR